LPVSYPFRAVPPYWPFSFLTKPVPRKKSYAQIHECCLKARNFTPFADKITLLCSVYLYHL